jgi:hypothetical protein
LIDYVLVLLVRFFAAYHGCWSLLIGVFYCSCRIRSLSGIHSNCITITVLVDRINNTSHVLSYVVLSTRLDQKQHIERNLYDVNRL